MTPQLWKNPREIPHNGIDDDGNGYIDDIHGIDTAYKDGSPFDDNWHGTHNHGLIGATVNNTRGVAGIAGISRSIRQLPCKFMDRDGLGTLAGALECMEYAVEHGASILHAAFGTNTAGLAAKNVFANVLDSLHLRGVLMVGAAGNLGQDADWGDWIPCSIQNKPSLLCVTAVSAVTGVHEPWANYG